MLARFDCALRLSFLFLVRQEHQCHKSQYNNEEESNSFLTAIALALFILLICLALLCLGVGQSPVEQPLVPEVCVIQYPVVSRARSRRCTLRDTAPDRLFESLSTMLEKFCLEYLSSKTTDSIVLAMEQLHLKLSKLCAGAHQVRKLVWQLHSYLKRAILAVTNNAREPHTGEC